jgi:hypothetical protein
MSQSKSSYISHLFTIRMWPEAIGANQVEWRGQVRHISSGQMYHFRDWQSLMEFMENILSSNRSASESETRGEDYSIDGTGE